MSRLSNPELAALPNLFLINPMNRPFVTGESCHINIYPKVKKTPAVWVKWIIMLLICSSFTVFISGYQRAAAIIYNRFHIHPDITCILLLALPTLVLFWIVNNRKKRRIRRLVEDGRLLVGYVNEWRTGEGKDEDSASIAICQLDFVFNTLDGRRLSDTTVFKICDPPQRGAPLAVLYVNDSLYEVL